MDVDGRASEVGPVYTILPLWNLDNVNTANKQRDETKLNPDGSFCKLNPSYNMKPVLLFSFMSQ